MDTYRRIEYNSYKGILLSILFVVLFVKSCVTNAQGYYQPHVYKGFSTSFGTRTFKLNSDIEKLDNLTVLQEGGSAGIVFGNNVVQSRFTFAGLYYSSARIPQTINLYELEATVDYAPLKSIMKDKTTRWDPYFLAGITQNFIKFYGHYLTDADNQPGNYSTLSDPLIGKINQTYATVGVGFRWSITACEAFIKCFAEARYGTPVFSGADEVLKNTSVSNYAAFNAGVSFGLQR